VALVVLTSPLVVIHAPSTYYDLFANSFMAIGTTGIVGLFLFNRQHERNLLRWVLFGLVGAAWSKIILIPFVGIALGSLFVYYVRTRPKDKAWAWIVACAAISAVPYVRNLLLFHNPIWPFHVPFLPRVPYVLDFVERETPPLLIGAPHYEVFFRSLFEIDQPVSYPSRARYVIDQGRAFAGFRSGGFWGIGVMAYLAILGRLAALYSKRKAAWLGIGVVGTLVLIAVLPDAHNLRYVMFLPLSWAALIGMFELRLSDRFPWLMSGVLVVAGTLFAYMAYVNEEYFKIESVDYKKAAAMWEADQWWPALEHDDLYCAVKPPYPSAFFLTGPTMHEFKIVEASASKDCARDAIVLAWGNPFPSATEREETELMTEAFAPGTDARRRLDLLREVTERNPDHYGAHVQLARALDSAGEKGAALRAWRATRRLELLRGYGGADAAYSRERIRVLAAEVGGKTTSGRSTPRSRRRRRRHP
jgi:hypothetical protein